MKGLKKHGKKFSPFEMAEWLDFVVLVVIQVVLIFLVLIVIATAQWAMADDLPTITQDVDPFDIQSGDLLVIGYRGVLGMFVTAWSFSKWTHSGVAWRDPQTGQLFVMEASRYGGKYNNVFRIPFDLWLKINKKQHLCHLKLHSKTPFEPTGEAISPYLMDEKFKELESIYLDRINPEWYRLLLWRPYKEEVEPRPYTCYEITIMLLQRLGIMQKKYACSSYFARDVVWRHLHMEPNYFYSDPVLLHAPQTPD